MGLGGLIMPISYFTDYDNVFVHGHFLGYTPSSVHEAELCKSWRVT